MTLAVVGTGFGRTGTLSLKVALEQLGFGPCFHMLNSPQEASRVETAVRQARGEPDWNLLFAGYVSVLGAGLHWESMVRRYPAARVIHTVRDRAEWESSIRATTPQVSGVDFETEIAKKVAQFDARLREVVDSLTAERLLVFNVKEGWGPLCKFLGVSEPAVAFPAENDRRTFLRRAERSVSTNGGREPTSGRAHLESRSEYRLGLAAASRGNSNDARTHFQRAAALSPKWPEAHNNLGVSLLEQGDFHNALGAFRAALALEPTLAVAHHNVGLALERIGRLPEALGSFREAIRLRPDYPEALSHIATILHSQGQFTEAVDAYRAVLELKPNSPSALFSLATSLIAIQRHDAAVLVFTQLLTNQPALVGARVNMGMALMSLGQISHARQHLERAVADAPAHPGALAALAELVLDAGELSRAKRLANEAIVADPLSTQARLVLAEVELEEAAPELAEARLIPLAARDDARPELKAKASGLLGDALHDQRRFDDAFLAYSAANEHLRQRYSHVFASEPSVLDEAIRLRGEFAKTSLHYIAPVNHSPAASFEPRSHVFLVGFPRSGTTLLGQVLGSHQDVETLDESVAVPNAFPDLRTQPGALGRLAALTEDQLADLRQIYWRTTYRAVGSLHDKVFVDKLPLNIIWLPVIARLFPSSKILLCLRDPRDVVLSCFRRTFTMNAYMHQFLTLRGVAEYYNAVMSLADDYMSRLPLRSHQLFYEEFVLDFEAHTRSLCDFLEIDWTPDLLRFGEKSRSSDISTPSAKQVRRGLYNGRGQWSGYARHLEPVVPLLQPWIEKFDYDELSNPNRSPLGGHSVRQSAPFH